jgi:hypothetical protein
MTANKTNVSFNKFVLFVQFVIIRIIRFLSKIARGGVLLPLLSCCFMVPKGGFEPPRGSPTTPSRWRVYQFHHFGINHIIKSPQPPFTKGGKEGTSILPLLLRLRYRNLRLNGDLRGFCRGRLGRPLFDHRGGPSC